MGAAATMLSAEPIAMKAASVVETMVDFLYVCVLFVWVLVCVTKG